MEHPGIHFIGWKNSFAPQELPAIQFFLSHFHFVYQFLELRQLICLSRGLANGFKIQACNYPQRALFVWDVFIFKEVPKLMYLRHLDATKNRTCGKLYEMLHVMNDLNFLFGMFIADISYNFLYISINDFVLFNISWTSHLLDGYCNP